MQLTKADLKVLSRYLFAVADYYDPDSFDELMRMYRISPAKLDEVSRKMALLLK